VRITSTTNYPALRFALPDCGWDDYGNIQLHGTSPFEGGQLACGQRLHDNRRSRRHAQNGGLRPE
jgi:hypothetical protein